ncbi:MAG TPA: NAD(P)-dependent oxidoreductase [Lentisphaeria bacterium]|nr:NAD(P)-dependent oxidoreductase [Lentisphaeria bacterium]
MTTAARSVSILGCGWLGTALGATLAADGWQVRGSTMHLDRFDALRAHHIDPVQLIVDAAGVWPACDAFWQSNALIISIPPGRRTDAVVGFADRIRAVCRAWSAPPEQVILLSSTSVYAATNRPVSEGEINPSHVRLKPSGRALLEAEAVIADAAAHATILRLAGLIGPDRHPGRFLAGKKNVAGGDVPVNLVHRRDCVAIITQILAESHKGEVFNVVADAHPTRREYYVRAAERLGLPPPSFANSENESWKIVRNDKLKQALSYSFRVPDPASCLSDE